MHCFNEHIKHQKKSRDYKLQLPEKETEAEKLTGGTEGCTQCVTLLETTTDSEIVLKLEPHGMYADRHIMCQMISSLIRLSLLLTLHV